MLTYKLTRTTTTALLAALLAAATLFATLSAMAAEPGKNATPICHAQLAAIHTAFPQALQSRGEHGLVKLKVVIDKNGRAASAQVSTSSGYPALDKAAADSVLQSWRFDVSACSANEVPADSAVTVNFEQAARNTVSGTRNRQQTNMANNSDSASRCDIARDTAGDAVVACVTGASLANRTNAQNLARVDGKNRQ